MTKWLCCLTSKSVFLCVRAMHAHPTCYLLGGSGGRGLSWCEERWGECRGEGWWRGPLVLGERVPRELEGWPNCWRRSEPDLICVECEERVLNVDTYWADCWTVFPWTSLYHWIWRVLYTLTSLLPSVLDNSRGGKTLASNQNWLASSSLTSSFYIATV